MDNTSYVLLALLLNAPNLSAHTISTDYCDPKSYTDEVRNLTCDNKGIRFRADGLPHPDHPLMTGITATNQQFPVKHNYEFSITNSPKVSAIKTTPDAGPIGVAVNGIPIFDPATQGPVNPITGKRPSTLDAGELDTCGGHAGRGDDYHYHVAPQLPHQATWRQHDRGGEETDWICHGWSPHSCIGVVQPRQFRRSTTGSLSWHDRPIRHLFL